MSNRKNTHTKNLMEQTKLINIKTINCVAQPNPNCLKVYSLYDQKYADILNNGVQVLLEKGKFCTIQRYPRQLHTSNL